MALEFNSCLWFSWYMKCGIMRKIVTWEGIHVSARAPRRRVMKENVRISVYHKRHEDLVQFFKTERGLIVCTDIHGLMQTLNINHNPLDWRLFTDASQLSLKQFSVTVATPYLQFLLVLRYTRRSHMRKDSNGSY
jgi:hypothetical protein